MLVVIILAPILHTSARNRRPPARVALDPDDDCWYSADNRRLFSIKASSICVGFRTEYWECRTCLSFGQWVSVHQFCILCGFS